MALEGPSLSIRIFTDSIRPLATADRAMKMETAYPCLNFISEMADKDCPNFNQLKLIGLGTKRDAC